MRTSILALAATAFASLAPAAHAASRIVEIHSLEAWPLTSGFCIVERIVWFASQSSGNVHNSEDGSLILATVLSEFYLVRHSRTAPAISLHFGRRGVRNNSTRFFAAFRPVIFTFDCSLQLGAFSHCSFAGVVSDGLIDGHSRPRIHHVCKTWERPGLGKVSPASSPAAAVGYARNSAAPTAIQARADNGSEYDRNTRQLAIRIALAFSHRSSRQAVVRNTEFQVDGSTRDFTALRVLSRGRRES